MVGLRQGQHRLDPADRRVLELLAAPLAVALYATALSAELQRSRERIVTAREEERRRLRRDLHCTMGWGPVLTGIGFQADAAGNLVRTDPERALELLGRLRAETSATIDDVRRLVDDLRPPALDELGLLGALREHAERLSRHGGPVVAVEAPAALPPLRAAVEVAAFRIATRRSPTPSATADAVRIEVRIGVADGLRVEVRDDGRADGGIWRPGMGLRSMRERTSELGGSFRAGPCEGGGCVVAALPLEAG